MKRDGWRNNTLLSSTIFSFFLFMQKDDKKKLGLCQELLGAM